MSSSERASVSVEEQQRLVRIARGLVGDALVDGHGLGSGRRHLRSSASRCVFGLTVAAVASSAAAPTSTRWRSLSKPDLVSACAKAGLRIDGQKSDLVNRLERHVPHFDLIVSGAETFANLLNFLLFLLHEDRDNSHLYSVKVVRSEGDESFLTGIASDPYNQEWEKDPAKNAGLVVLQDELGFSTDASINFAYNFDQTSYFNCKVTAVHIGPHLVPQLFVMQTMHGPWACSATITNGPTYYDAEEEPILIQEQQQESCDSNKSDESFLDSLCSMVEAPTLPTPPVENASPEARLRLAPAADHPPVFTQSVTYSSSPVCARPDIFSTTHVSADPVIYRIPAVIETPPVVVNPVAQTSISIKPVADPPLGQEPQKRRGRPPKSSASKKLKQQETPSIVAEVVKPVPMKKPAAVAKPRGPGRPPKAVSSRIIEPPPPAPVQVNKKPRGRPPKNTKVIKESNHDSDEYDELEEINGSASESDDRSDDEDICEDLEDINHSDSDDTEEEVEEEEYESMCL
ncbi:hypothetical protein BCR33DRAFT_764285 [Rhizoclosmatium globosum]|uniref:SAP domain-containing protein n=1 Tax=Rhizoclosmatium globosum TaxID=329046 RepID=A0A1Y2CK38_9FUNG|nr:hypothetical protein BCR33DRAFT_764285 [Rhizoclosmatium globosum]|eukprot:ORY47214.1 hypothetical protein BCR33DRAFT_764285 [Rhizoclosmatium globosum]